MKKRVTIPGSRGRLIRGPGGQRIDIKKLERKEREKEKLLAVMLDEADPELYPAASDFIDSIPEFESLSETIESGAELVQEAAIAIKKLSREEHLARVMAAYSFWIRSGRQKAYELLVRNALRLRKKHNPKTTKLHLLVESLISYGESIDGQRKYSKLYNRDVQAIRWLNSEGISPHDATALALQKGEGLDNWADRWAKNNKKDGASPASSDVDANLGVSAQPVSPAVVTASGENLIPPESSLSESVVKITWEDPSAGERFDLRIRRTAENEAALAECLRVLNGMHEASQTKSTKT